MSGAARYVSRGRQKAFVKTPVPFPRETKQGALVSQAPSRLLDRPEGHGAPEKKTNVSQQETRVHRPSEANIDDRLRM